MRGQLFLAGLSLVVGTVPVMAQFPPPAPLPGSVPLPTARGPAVYQPISPPIQIPHLPNAPKNDQPIKRQGPDGPYSTAGYPAEPRSLPTLTSPSAISNPKATGQPNATGPSQPGLPDGSTLPPLQAEVPLPYAEAKIPIETGAVVLKRVQGSWQVWAGQRVLKDLGEDEMGAKEVVRVIRELRPTEWAWIGSPRPVVEYGLINGRPPITAGFPRVVVPIDLRAVRVEAIKGVWCLRDDGNILFNFGLHKLDADQALAIVRRYGFNRIGMIGSIAAPTLTYFYVALESEGAGQAAINPLVVAAQEASLARTGIPIPGIGYVGEMMKFDSQRVAGRRDGADWVVAAGTEIIARFGPNDWAARDAARMIKDCRFNEFCRIGSTGFTFFLIDGKGPTHVPLATQGRRFDLAALKVHSLGSRWAVTENGRHLFDVGGPEEGEMIIRVLRYFHFDQLCELGGSTRANLTFLARSR